MCLDICNRSNIFADIKSNANLLCPLQPCVHIFIHFFTDGADFDHLAIQGGSPSPFDRSLATKVAINDRSLKSFWLQMLDNHKHIFHYTDFYQTRVRSLVMLVTNWLTNWLTHSVTFSRLDGCEWCQLPGDVVTVFWVRKWWCNLSSAGEGRQILDRWSDRDNILSKFCM